MKDVKYFAPTGVDEALGYLAQYGGRATILAGGTDVVPRINYYESKPDVLVYVGGIGSDYIKDENGKLIIGAGTTWSELITNALVAEKAGVLAEAARRGGCVAIRNAGTIAGNLVNASPAADLATPLLVMDADVVINRSDGKRVVPLKDFFVGPGKTILNPDELVTEIHVPFVKGNAVFLKLGRRRAMTLSVVNTAVRIYKEGKTCKEARIAVGSMAPTPMRCKKAELMLVGKGIDRSLITECAAEAIRETSPIDDQRATAWYRKKAGKNLVARALALAAENGEK
jgi:carbon-monoxide dehydrogenase medium subunit